MAYHPPQYFEEVFYPNTFRVNKRKACLSCKGAPWFHPWLDRLSTEYWQRVGGLNSFFEILLVKCVHQLKLQSVNVIGWQARNISKEQGA